MSASKKLGVVAVVVLAVIVVAVVLVYANLSTLTKRIVEKKVPNLTFTKLTVGWNDVELAGVQYTSNAGKVVLKTDLLRVKPSLLSIFGDTFKVSLVEIEKPYVYIERRPDGQVVLPVPQVSGGAAPSKTGAETGKPFAVHVGKVEIRDGVGEFVDKSVGRPYADYKIKDVNIEVENLDYPQKAAHIPVDIAMSVEGAREGRLTTEGWVDPTARSGKLDVRVKDLFIPLAEPYYRSKDTTARLSDGTLGLKLDLKMNQGKVFLPGEVSMANLKFAGDSGLLFGVPVKVIGQYFKNQKKALTIPFEVEGSIDRPDEIRVRVISVIVRHMIEKLGGQQVQEVTDKLKKGDVKGAKKQVKDIQKQLKGLFK